MKLKELLKARGWTDEQISAAFADPKTVEVLDDIFGTVTSERDTLKARDAEWQKKLDEEYNPAIAKAEKAAAEARLKAANYEEQLKIAKDYGYLSSDEAEKRATEAAAAAAARNNSENYDPKRHPTYDDVAKFADAEGEAIALANDLNEEYRYLSGGKSLFEYETTINGQSMRGMRALRQEAKAVRKDFGQYVSEKFDFAGKRRAMQEQRQKEHDEQVAKEAEDRVRREYAEKLGNPMLAQPIPSRVPFVPAKNPEGKQPWERGTSNERRAQRIQHAVQSQLKSPVVQ